jgi:hypothetical protein
MLNNTSRAGAVEAASRYSSGSDPMMRSLLLRLRKLVLEAFRQKENFLKWFLGLIQQGFGFGCTFSWFVNQDPHSKWNIFAKTKNFWKLFCEKIIKTFWEIFALIRKRRLSFQPHPALEPHDMMRLRNAYYQYRNADYRNADYQNATLEPNDLPE